MRVRCRTVRTKATATYKAARLLFEDEQFCRNENKRVGAALELVGNLPRTAGDIKLILTKRRHRLSHEVQYSVLNMLDSVAMKPADIRRLLPAIEQLLHSVDSRVAGVWMKLGCSLGGGWYQDADRTTRKYLIHVLIHAVRNCKSVHARAAALHGFEHALNTASLTTGKVLLDVMRDVVESDRSLSLRRSAYSILESGWWWGNRGLAELHRYARSIGKKLEYPETIRRGKPGAGRVRLRRSE